MSEGNVPDGETAAPLPLPRTLNCDCIGFGLSAVGTECVQCVRQRVNQTVCYEKMDYDRH